MKTLIFKELSENLVNETDIDNIIDLMDCLEGKEKRRYYKW